MSILEITILAVSVCLDSFAVSISSGMVHCAHPLRHALRLGICFALFQTVMPILGWLAGMQMKAVIEGVDHWIAFGLLFAIGAKMIIESRHAHPEKPVTKKCSTRMLCGMGLATSIDALVIGITFAFVNTTILPAVAIIGGMTFLFAFTGVYLGKKLGVLFKKMVTIIGGALLICMGFEILIEHLMLSR